MCEHSSSRPACLGRACLHLALGGLEGGVLQCAAPPQASSVLWLGTGKGGQTPRLAQGLLTASDSSADCLE